MNTEKRSMALSDAYFVRSVKAAWSVWNIQKAVREGYQANGWVYRAITLIMQNAASVPWVVYGEDNEIIYDHPLASVLSRPNPHWTRQRLIETLVSWLELSGNAYLKKVVVGGKTVEIWPISPDRIAPIPSRDPTKFIEGYYTRNDGGEEVRNPDYTAENTVHIKLTDPANPYYGISPLGAASRSVDLDNEQQDWNTATMQNRGVVDGVFTFKRQLDQLQSASLIQRIKDRFSGKANARTPMVIGDDATYTRLGLNPVELDFLESRKFNREEIFSIFGIPPQLAGSQEASTYNNFSASMRVFWETTIIPLLDNISDSLNHAFWDELGGNGKMTVGYDLSNVDAVRESQSEKAAVAKSYHAMGVPFNVINEHLKLGISEFEGWDSAGKPPDPNAAQMPDDSEDDQRSFELVPFEQRNVDQEIALRDKFADGEVFELIRALLEKQSRAVLFAAESGGDILAASARFDSEWDATLQQVYETVGVALGLKIARPRRSANQANAVRKNEPYTKNLLAAIRAALVKELTILKERSFIQQTVAKLIARQSEYAVKNGLPPTQLAQGIKDAGAFSPERALRIARTTSGAATSIGQYTAGKAAGATHKVWLTSNDEAVRSEHDKRANEVVEIDSRFSALFPGPGPLYPLDPEIDAGDRINCRCFMRFQFRPAAKKPAAPPPATPVIPTPNLRPRVANLDDAISFGVELVAEILALNRTKNVTSLSQLTNLEFRQTLQEVLKRRKIDTGLSAGLMEIKASAINAKSNTTQFIDKFAQYFPKDASLAMFKKSLLPGGRMEASYKPNERGSSLPRKYGKPKIKYDNYSTFVHEFLHQVQAEFPEFDAVFQQIHKNRTKGEPLQRLSVLTGHNGYKSHEVARPDKYPRAYYGREYGEDGALEIVTMIGEAVLGGDPQKWEEIRKPENRDMLNAFLGALYGFKF
jgi:HK97 family phage portal protein